MPKCSKAFSFREIRLTDPHRRLCHRPPLGVMVMDPHYRLALRYRAHHVRICPLLPSCPQHSQQYYSDLMNLQNTEKLGNVRSPFDAQMLKSFQLLLTELRDIGCL